MLKRRAIVIVTFIAGLYYLLEFLLPARIGGSPDADGVEAATVVTERAVTPEGNGQRFIAYTGLRTDRRPVILRVAEDGSGPRVPLIAPHFARHDDYRGTTKPLYVPPDRLYYIGLGWDDRTPRLCLAMRRDGRWIPGPKAVLSNGSPGEPDASGIGWVAVLPPQSSTSGEWRLWYVGLQGDMGTLCYATSRDGVSWAKQGPVAAGEWEGLSVRGVSSVPAENAVHLWLVVSNNKGPRQVIVARVEPSGMKLMEKPVPAQLDLPSAHTLRDLRIEGSQGWATLESEDGKTSVAAVTVSSTPPAVKVARERIVVPGAQPRTTYLSDIRGTVDDMLVVIGAFAVGLGLIGLAQVHGKRLLALQRGWPESTAFFVAAMAMATFTVYARLNPEAQTWGKRAYDLLFYGLLQPLGSSMFSLLAAYLVSAAYRAFRVKSFEGALMAASATLIMLGQVPVGNWLTQNLPPFLQIPKVMAWVLFVNNTAVVRAVNFGIFVGALATALRVWLSMDRASMRSVE